MIDLSIITVTYNNEKTIGNFLKSLLNNFPSSTELIIVDSGSTDKTTNLIDENKKVKLIKSAENIGFGKGCNLASKSSQGEYLLFLNPDTEVIDGSIEKLINFLRFREDVGIVGSKLLEGGSKVQPSVRKLPSIWGAIKEYYFGIKESYEAYFPSGETPVEVESIVGAVMLIRKELFLSLGGFDERFFMYFEDLDICRKVRQKGLKVVYIPESIIIHKVGSSFSPLKQKFLRDSARIYHGTIKFFLLDLILRLRPRAH